MRIFVNILWIHKYVDKEHFDENMNEIIDYESLLMKMIHGLS